MEPVPVVDLEGRNAVAAWPFAATRNRTLDWRPVLAPPFLIDVGADYLLVQETAGGDGDRSQVRHIHTPQTGALTLFFRRRPLTAAIVDAPDAADGEAELLCDRFGRPVSLVEGLVLRGHYDIAAPHLGSSLDAVGAEAAPVLAAFWDATDEETPPAASAPMPISARLRRSELPGSLAAGLLAAATGGLLLLRRLLRRASGTGDLRGEGTEWRYD